MGWGWGTEGVRGLGGAAAQRTLAENGGQAQGLPVRRSELRHSRRARRRGVGRPSGGEVRAHSVHNEGGTEAAEGVCDAGLARRAASAGTCVRGDAERFEQQCGTWSPTM